MKAKIFQSFLCVFLASTFASSAYTDPIGLDVYVKTNYKNQPDLSKYGAKELRMIYAQSFWSEGRGDRELLPSKDRVIKYVAGKYKDYPGLLVLDIEHWPLIGSDAQVSSRVKKFITVLEWVKSAAPKAKVGYYSVAPTPGYWQLLKSPSDPKYIKWKKDNDRAQALADRVDALFPNLYAVHANQDNWMRAATVRISEAKRLGKGKPVYLVINPRYHSQAYDNLRYQPIPKDFFKLQLETIKAARAKGVVIWGADNKKNPWSENLPWWQATKEFLGWN